MTFCLKKKDSQQLRHCPLYEFSDFPTQFDGFRVSWFSSCKLGKLPSPNKIFVAKKMNSTSGSTRLILKSNPSKCKNGTILTSVIFPDHWWCVTYMTTCQKKCTKKKGKSKKTKFTFFLDIMHYEWKCSRQLWLWQHCHAYICNFNLDYLILNFSRRCNFLF